MSAQRNANVVREWANPDYVVITGAGARALCSLPVVKVYVASAKWGLVQMLL